MSTRPQRSRQRNRLGPATGVEPTGDLAIALLKAATLEQLAPLVLRYAEAVFACHSVRLVWVLSAAVDGRPLRHRYPDTTPSPLETSLIDAALDIGTDARSFEPDTGKSCIASVLGDPLAGPKAVLLTDWPGAVGLPGDEAAWHAFVSIASARVGSLLDLASQRLAVQRMGNAARVQGALYTIADLASGALDMPEMLRSLHAVVGELMYAENFLIALYTAERDTLRFIYFVDAHDAAIVDAEEEIPAESFHNSLTLAVIRHGRPAWGPSTRLFQEFGLEWDQSYGPNSADWLGVPMLAEGQVRGAVVVQSYDQAGRYSEEDRALLAFVAQHILTALVRKQAHAELERRVEERTRELTAEVLERQRGERLQAALYCIADLASSELAMGDMLRRIHAVVGELMYARNFLIAMYSAARETLRFIYFADEQEDTAVVSPDEEIPVTNLRGSLTLTVIRHGRSLMGPSMQLSADVGIDHERQHGPEAADWLGVPIVANSKVCGAVVVQTYDPSVHYTEEDSALLSYVAQHIQTAMSRKQAHTELDRRVRDGTRELASAVNELRDQIGERERIEQQLMHEALHDSLTGLPNRSFLLDAIDRALSRLERDPLHRFAVLFLDLDRFKVVNDSVGHLVGDEMLKQAAERIAGCVSAPDVVARLGGDEFALLLEDIRGPEDAYHAAQRIIDALGESMLLAGKELFPSASIGIAFGDARYSDAADLLRDADVAMYRAKAHGRHCFEVFDQHLHREALRLLDLEGDLRRAILHSEFEPYFQSIVRLSDGCVVGWESLLRWNHPQRGVLLPGEFLSVAEESGTIEQIDWQMFEKTCREIPSLVGNGGYVTLNVSAQHFRSPALAQKLLGLLAAHHVPPECVRIEMTEGALFENPDQVRATLETLAEVGVFAVLDDFGTGYSSLSYLHRFPLRALKIDRSFVTDLQPGQIGGSTAIVRAVLALAGTLGMQVVAEGIESRVQRDWLLELGCELGQGFLFALPQPVAAWIALSQPTSV
jgi:diguanylate cyclase (GGDEF)-like protein